MTERQPRLGYIYMAVMSGALICCSATAALSQAPVVQPGAPGQASKTVTETAPAQLRTPTAADITFMQGMIMHHGQAVEMTVLMATRTKNPDLLSLGKRISISQTDEMGFMKRWLEERGIPIAPAPAHDMAGMAGMDHMDGMDMGSMPSMPGMLTEKQMEALRKATGPEFDHLFLTGMIQHHSGALQMVKTLFDTPGAGQDAVLFDFTSDVDNTQLAEIDIMRHMLAKEKQ